MAKFMVFIIFFVIGILGGAYLKQVSSSPTEFVVDATGRVIEEIETENINFIFNPLNSISIDPVIVSASLLVLLVLFIFIITKTFSTLTASLLGLAGGTFLFFVPVMSIIVLVFGVFYTLILEEVF